MKNEKEIPDHCSAVRSMISEAQGTEYKSFEYFEEARKSKNAVVIMEGDWGGQIYLTCPMTLVKCGENALKSLLLDLNQIAWPGNEGEGTGIYYEQRVCGELIAGGMGGGLSKDCLWVHEEFRDMYDRIKGVIEGERTRI